MPKKMGINTKAAEAKARKNEKKEAVVAAKQKQEEDEYWKDDDKRNMKKEAKKMDKEAKKVQQQELKKEKQKMLEEETAQIVKKQPPTKVTQYQLNQMNKTTLPKKKIEKEEEIPDNLNHVQAEGDASNIDDAIAALTLNDPTLQKHPEKKIKAAFKAYVDERMDEMKNEKKLRRNQIIEVLWKEFQKSPSNPKNQEFAEYNAK